MKKLKSAADAEKSKKRIFSVTDKNTGVSGA